MEPWFRDVGEAGRYVNAARLTSVLQRPGSSAIDGGMVTKLPAHKAPRSYQEILSEVVQDVDALDVVFVADRQQSCMGVGGALGHPKVFYTIGDKGYVECMYCDRVFVLDEERAGTGHAGHPVQPALPRDGITENAALLPAENPAGGRDNDA